MKRARKAKRTHATAATIPAEPTAGVSTVRVPLLSPRNPYVALVHRRKAGVHGSGNRIRRQTEKRELLRTKLHED